MVGCQLVVPGKWFTENNPVAADLAKPLQRIRWNRCNGFDEIETARLSNDRASISHKNPSAFESLAVSSNPLQPLFRFLACPLFPRPQSASQNRDIRWIVQFRSAWEVFLMAQIIGFFLRVALTGAVILAVKMRLPF